MAAVALLHGWANPVALLDLDGVDEMVAHAIIQAAVDMHHDRTKAIIEGIGVAVGNAVGKVFGG